MTVSPRALTVALATLAALTVTAAPVAAGTAVAKPYVKTNDRTHDGGRKVR